MSDRNLVAWYDAGLVAGDPPMSLFESARAVLAGTPSGEGVEADDDVLCDRCGRCPGVASDGSTPYCHFCSHECTFTRVTSIRQDRPSWARSPAAQKLGVTATFLGKAVWKIAPSTMTMARATHRWPKSVVPRVTT